MSYWIVGTIDDETAIARRLAICATHSQAAVYIGTLPNFQDGRYYLDGPINDVIELDREGNK